MPSYCVLVFVQDLFYPEFATIRATGVLPDGRILPNFVQQDSKNVMNRQSTRDKNMNQIHNNQQLQSMVSNEELPQTRHSLVGANSRDRQLLEGRQSSSSKYDKQVPLSDRISETLYGREKPITGYDFNASVAPKAKSSGNPFA